MLGKFTFVPTSAASAEPSDIHGPQHFTQDWRRRQSAGPLDFTLQWIPFISDRDTPLDDLTTPWNDARRVTVGTVTFPRVDPDAREVKLTALLASELGANPGNWLETPDGTGASLPSTRFTAARFLAYRASQKNRGALSDESYAAFFERGEIGPDLARELVRRYEAKRAAGHWVPDVGELALA